MSTPPPNPYASSPKPQEPWGGQQTGPQQPPAQPQQGIPPQGDPYQQPGYGPSAESAYEPGGPGGPGMDQGVPAGAPYQQPKPAPGTDLGADLGASLTWMWQAFTRNLGAFLVPGIVWFVSSVVLALIVTFGGAFASVAASESPTDGVDGGLSAGLFVLTVIVAFLVILAPSLLWQSGVAKAAGIVHGAERPTIGRAFIGSGRIIGTIVLYMLVTLVGMVALVIPGLIAAVLFFFAVPAAVQGASPTEALRESLAVVKANLATTIIAYLIVTVAMSVLSYLVITVVAALPLLVLVQFALYQRLNGRELPEPVRA